MTSKLLLASAALIGLAISSVGANSSTYGRLSYRHHRSHSSQYRNYEPGLGLRKQTATGGPSGGSTKGGGK